MANLTEESADFAADVLDAKAHALYAQQLKLRLGIVRDMIRDWQLGRDINGCFAGASALGFGLIIEGRPPTGKEPPELKAFLAARAAVMPLLDYFKNLVPPDLDETLAPLPPQAAQVIAPTMPRVADVVLGRLRAANAEGAKAAEIRSFISQTYHVEVHEKTVGMTLYRLQKDGLVRRDGHTWFLASQEAKNPGAEDAGATNRDDKKGEEL